MKTKKTASNPGRVRKIEPPWAPSGRRGQKGRLFRYHIGDRLNGARLKCELKSAEERRTSFLWAAGAAAAAWLYFWIN